MKKLMFLCSFVLIAGMASAQTCSKSAKKACCASKATTAAVETAPSSTQVASVIAEADALAMADETIEKTVCSASGKVSYHQKSVCAKSGKVSTNEVMYDSAEKAFVNSETNNMVKSTTAEVLPVAENASKDAKSCSKSSKQCAKACSKKAAAIEQ